MKHSHQRSASQGLHEGCKHRVRMGNMSATAFVRVEEEDPQLLGGGGGVNDKKQIKNIAAFMH